MKTKQHSIIYIIVPQWFRPQKSNLCLEYCYSSSQHKTDSQKMAAKILRRKKQEPHHPRRFIAIACCIDGTTISRDNATGKPNQFH